MAETQTSESANREHNVSDLNKVIRECRDQMLEIKKERKELNERAGDVRERLRNSGIQVAAFDYSLKLYEMEAEARNEYIDSLRLNMEAMSIGGQGTLFVDGADTEADAQHKASDPGFEEDPEPKGKATYDHDESDLETAAE